MVLPFVRKTRSRFVVEGKIKMLQNLASKLLTVRRLRLS